MDEMTPSQSTAQVLGEFFTHAEVTRRPTVRHRVGAVRQHLDVYLDTEAERVLTSDERTLVEAEREIDPVCAVARVTGADALVAALPGFLDESWLLPTAPDARAQVRIVEALTAWTVEHGLVDRVEMSCFLLTVRDACRRARAVIKSPAVPGR